MRKPSVIKLYATLPLALLLMLAAPADTVSAAAMTATMPNGVSITTTVTPASRKVTYAWDFSNLAGDYTQVDISQPQFPSSLICAGCVAGTDLTGYVVFDAAGGSAETRLQLQYEGGSPPPRSNSVELTYAAGQIFTGFIDGTPAMAGDDGNVAVSFRDPPGGEYKQLWAFTPAFEPAQPGSHPPQADAGTPQTVPVASIATLDGSASSDSDGDPLTYAWSLTSIPAGSTAALSDPTAVKPTFHVDLPGVYAVQLIVSDGVFSSTPATVRIDTANSAPVADAGTAQNVPVGATVTLDGSASSDVDGDPLRFAWTLVSLPAGSMARLDDPSAVRPSFTVDLPGSYQAGLVVSDGALDSAPDSVTVSTINSAPQADAGAARTVRTGDIVVLDGSASRDADGDPLHFAWSFTVVPTSSAAALSDPAAVRPDFTVDLAGLYVIQLIVHDGTTGSTPDSVAISTVNSAPVAEAGPAQQALAGDVVTLDGSASSDPDGDPVSFRWGLTSMPAGSSATLSGQATTSPAFVADLPGLYIAQLIVNDGAYDSAPDTVSVSATAAQPPPAQPAAAGVVAAGSSGGGCTVLPAATSGDPTLALLLVSLLCRKRLRPAGRTRRPAV